MVLVIALIFISRILFVEDPGSQNFGPALKPDTTWNRLLKELVGVENYDWYGPTYRPDEDGPDSTLMSQYELVIWNCYDYWWGSGQGQPPCLTATDQENIGRYIEKGGSFWLIGQDAIYSGVPYSWLQTYFHLEGYVQDYAQNAPILTERGERELAGLTVSFRSDYQYSNFYCDNLFPAPDAHTVLLDQTYPDNHPAIIYLGNYRTTFWTIDGREPDNWATWKEMASRIINTLTVAGRESNLRDGIITISPNPTRNRITITCLQNLKDPILIHDQTGRIVKEIQPHCGSLFLDRLPPGIYFVVVHYHGLTYHRKLVILR
ncbi:hypothetical protein DRP53_08410 [candidate division WOR-3 bacterium]|uniref:Secretion system C-terminal sorting domain-containing protein n=1 Tax=candidate division WOR-3 bacterium TaxID=2052148 RepID=A0A660SH96_UNCW3|nr:MAG: hypothetical protein DRP53_08410 [candidate division WOR-3 bacterium]